MSPDATNHEKSLLPVLARHAGPPLAPQTCELGLCPSDGSRVLNQVAEVFKNYLVLPAGAADALALMIAHFHCYDAFLHTPRLSFQAVEKGCGKTTALELTACLSPLPLIAESMSTAVLFRLTELQGVTILLDEVDAWLFGNEEMRGILNAGHRRAGQVLRCGSQNSVRKYKVFAPVVLAGIGALPDTLQDRSIIIRLTRAKPGEIKMRFDPRRTAFEEQLRARLARWTSDNFSRLELCEPAMPAGLQNRAADNWRPLFAIAEVAGADWPQRAVAAFRLLAGGALADDRSIRSTLIADIRAIFGTVSVDRMPSAQLASELAKLEGQPWSEYKANRAISVNQIAQLLRGFGIAPRTIRFGTNLAKGYYLEDFADAFQRFLPLKP